LAATVSALFYGDFQLRNKWKKVFVLESTSHSHTSVVVVPGIGAKGLQARRMSYAVGIDAPVEVFVDPRLLLQIRSRVPVLRKRILSTDVPHDRRGLAHHKVSIFHGWHFAMWVAVMESRRSYV